MLSKVEPVISFPNVSVIIATYNRKGLLKEAILSVLEQSYENFELIIIDDGSTDDTQKMVASLSDHRIKYIYQENLGRSYARNRGISMATGRYITFNDSDDLYLPHKLALQVEYLDKHPAVGMVYTSAHCIDNSGKLLRHQYVAKESGLIYNKIAFFVPVTITLPTVMVRSEIFAKTGGFDEVMHRFEDTDMWRRISKVTHIGAINIYTCKLRTHADNHLLAQNPAHIISALHYYVKKALIEDSNRGFSLKRRVGALYYHYAIAIMSVSHWERLGMELLHEAFSYWPLYRISWMRKKALTYILKTLGLYKKI